MKCTSSVLYLNYKYDIPVINNVKTAAPHCMVPALLMLLALQPFDTASLVAPDGDAEYSRGQNVLDSTHSIQ